jgi:hypothetical protein
LSMAILTGKSRLHFRGSQGVWELGQHICSENGTSFVPFWH